MLLFIKEIITFEGEICRAITIAISIIGRAITIESEINPKIMERRLRAITYKEQSRKVQYYYCKIEKKIITG